MTDTERGSERESFFDRSETNNIERAFHRSEITETVAEHNGKDRNEDAGYTNIFQSKSQQERSSEYNRQDIISPQYHDTFSETNPPTQKFSSQHQQDRISEGNHMEVSVSQQHDRFSDKNRQELNATHPQDRFSDSNDRHLANTAHRQLNENKPRDFRFNNEVDTKDHGDRYNEPDGRFQTQGNRFQQSDNRGKDNDDQNSGNRYDNDRAPNDRFNNDNYINLRGQPDRFSTEENNNNRFRSDSSARVPSDRFTSNSDRFDDDHSASSGGRGRGYQGRGRGRYSGRLDDDHGRGRFNRDDSGGRFNEVANAASFESGGRGRFGERGVFRDGRGRIPFDPARGRGRSNFRGGGRGRGRDDGHAFESGRGSEFSGRWNVSRVNTYDRNESFDGGETDQHMASPKSPRAIYGGRGRAVPDSLLSPRGDRGRDDRGTFSSDECPNRNETSDDCWISRKRSFEVSKPLDYHDEKRSREDHVEPEYDRRENPLPLPQQEGIFQSNQNLPEPQVQQQQIEWSHQSDYPNLRERQDPRFRQDPRDRVDPRGRQNSSPSPPHAPARSTSLSAHDPIRLRSSPVPAIQNSVLGKPAFEFLPVPPFNDGPLDRDLPHPIFQKYGFGAGGRAGGRFVGRGFGGGRGRFDRGGRMSAHHRQGPPEGGLGSWNSKRFNDMPLEREERHASYASLAMDGPNPFRENDQPHEHQPEPEPVPLPLPVPVPPLPEVLPGPDVIPPSPPPEPAEPSAFTVAISRMVDLESQLDFAYAKHLQLVRQTQLLKAQVETLQDLPVGREAFQDDIDAIIATHDKIRKDAEERKLQVEEKIRREAAEAKKLEEAALRGRLASEDTADEGLIEEGEE